ncbi:MAG: RDD family protein [Oscillospiraceae bacterium]|nr:RDD family protein [Oscillospiraceae bacterium]
MPAASERITAGFFPRFCSYLLDRLILGILLLFVRVPMWVAALAGSELYSRAVLFHYSLREVVCAAVICAWFVLFTARRGATPGKKAMGLRVVNADGSDVSWKTAFLRETVGRYLSGLLCIGYLLMLGDREHRALHDRIFDTVVVWEERERKTSVPSRFLPTDPEAGWYSAGRI